MATNEHIRIQFLTLAQRRRRDDGAVAKVAIVSPIGTYSGHLIIDYCGYGRLSVQPARGAILHDETKDQILAEYYRRLGVQDRYAVEREAYGIYDLASCPDTGADPRAYIVHKVREDVGQYVRVDAPNLREAIRLAGASDTPNFYTYGIMAADYDEARSQDLTFNEADGLLL